MKNMGGISLILLLFCAGCFGAEIPGNFFENVNGNTTTITDSDSFLNIKNVSLIAFEETGAVSAGVIAAYLQLGFRNLDKEYKEAFQKLIHGLDERSNNLTLLINRIRENVNDGISNLEYVKFVERPITVGDHLVSLMKLKEDDPEIVKIRFINYCIGESAPDHILDFLMQKIVNRCPLPPRIRMKYYYDAMGVFLKFEKEYEKIEFLGLREDILDYILYHSNELDVIEIVKNLKALTNSSFAEFLNNLTVLKSSRKSTPTCWLTKIYSSNQMQIPAFEAMATFINLNLIKADELMMACSNISSQFHFLKQASDSTRIISDHVDSFRKYFIQHVWPHGIAIQAQHELDVSSLYPSLLNSTAGKIKRTINNMINRDSKFFVLITNLKDDEKLYTTCINKSDCLLITHSDIQLFIFKTKYQKNSERSKTTDAYFKECQPKIDKIFNETAGKFPKQMFDLIKEEACPQIQHHYKHILFGTEYIAESGFQIGFSFSPLYSYQHLYRYFDNQGIYVTGQEYHLFLMEI